MFPHCANLITKKVAIFVFLSKINQRTPGDRGRFRSPMQWRCAGSGLAAAVLPGETLERRGLRVDAQWHPASVQLFRNEFVHFL